jgi:rare lipoprotein A (peptidoglycan hydrolase)
MDSHSIVRGRGLRLAALAACLITTGTAYAATSPTGGQAAGTDSVTISGSGLRHVAYGERVRFAGAVAPRSAGRPVRLEYAPQGRDWQPVAKTKTAANGSYRLSVRARQSGLYRASGENGPSASRKVSVTAAVAAKGTRHVLGTRSVRVRGKLKPGLRGRRVALQRVSHGRWKTVDSARTKTGGRFRAAFRPKRAGRYKLRVKFAGDRMNGAASHRMRAYVYRPGQASYYGPGLYGGHLACGGTLSASKLGVASKTLPCGTKVTFRYHGRSVTVPVVDRGPYAAGRDWDLTTATKNKLGFGSTGTVWSTK